MWETHALLRYPRLGTAMRAPAANPTLARNCGIPTQRVIDAVWLITGALCGLAGVVAALDSDSFTISSGAGFLITALAAAVLGGAGQPYGAMIGAVVIGLITEMSAAVRAPHYQQVLAFPIPGVGGAVAGALLAVPIGLIVLRTLRSDYQAIALLVTSIIANTVINNARPWLNGAAGVALVPRPLNPIEPVPDSYLYFYIGLTAVCVALVWFIAARVVNSPFGRTLRAMRDQELAPTALGKNPVATKMTMFIVRAATAGLSCAILDGC